MDNERAKTRHIKKPSCLRSIDAELESVRAETGVSLSEEQYRELAILDVVMPGGVKPVLKMLRVLGLL